MGLAAAWRAVAAVVAPRVLAAPVLGLALLPLALNWGWASRSDDFTARDWAYNVLMSVEPYGVLVTNGDNDSFPLWYLQKVEGVREDVTIVLSPYLNLAWYVEQIRDLTRPCPPGVDPADRPTRIVCQRPFRPDRLPAPLRALGWAEGVRPPRDSIVPLSDEEIERIASGWIVTSGPVTLEAAGLATTIPEGTALSPADTFAAVILQRTLGERPIHFMPGSGHVSRLNLAAHTVRHGLTWRIDDGSPENLARVVPIPGADATPMLGAAIDLVATDTLLRDVFLRRGRLLDPGAPWVDPANTTIPLQYVLAYYAASQTHALLGNEQAARRHAREGRVCEDLIRGE